MSVLSPAVVAGRRSVAISFAANGFAFSTWVSRIPEVRGELTLGNGGLGLLLLCLSVGSLVSLPLAGSFVQRIGAAGVVRIGTLLDLVGLVGVALGALVWGSLPVTAVALLLYGVGTAVWDVSMNVEGAEVERHVGRTIMPRFHAAFSLGTVLGAGVGALAIAVGVPGPLHLVLGGAVVAAASLGTVGRFLPPAVHDDSGGPRVSAWRAWTEPRTLLIGVMVLALALTEGTANDWLALALVDGHGAAQATAVGGYALFVTAMTTGRLLGPLLLDRYGRVVVLWGSIALAAAGVLVLVLSLAQAAKVITSSAT